MNLADILPSPTWYYPELGSVVFPIKLNRAVQRPTVGHAHDGTPVYNRRAVPHSKQSYTVGTLTATVTCQIIHTPSLPLFISKTL